MGQGRNPRPIGLVPLWAAGTSRLSLAADHVAGPRRTTNAKSPARKLGLNFAERTGLEPAASGVTGRRYNRLNYRSKLRKIPKLLSI